MTFDSRVDDKRRDIEDPREASFDTKGEGEGEILNVLIWDKEEAANISSGLAKWMIY